MKKRNLIISGVILVLIFLTAHLHKNFYTKNMIVGLYANQNFDYAPFLAEIPYTPDTLRIFKDGKFISSYWGKGNYELSHSLIGTKIRLRYNYEFGRASFNTSVERIFFGSPKIILNKEQNHYYKKID